MRRHQIKIWPAIYCAIADGTKTFEVREDDRGYAVGDLLEFCEWEPSDALVGFYTGREAHGLVTYILTGGRFGIAPNTVVMSFKLIEEKQGRY